MASRGFEFAYMLDGSNATPVIRDFPVDGTGAYVVGDLTLVNSDGQLARVTGTTTEVTAIIQEARASGSDGDLLKAAVITVHQVWRCSMDAASTTAKEFYDRLIDTVDHNTIDADDLAAGRMMLVGTDTDNDGNVLAYVVFTVTSAGNALS